MQAVAQYTNLVHPPAHRDTPPTLSIHGAPQGRQPLRLAPPPELQFLRRCCPHPPNNARTVYQAPRRRRSLESAPPRVAAWTRAHCRSHLVYGWSRTHRSVAAMVHARAQLQLHQDCRRAPWFNCRSWGPSHSRRALPLFSSISLRRCSTRRALCHYRSPPTDATQPFRGTRTQLPGPPMPGPPRPSWRWRRVRPLHAHYRHLERFWTPSSAIAPRRRRSTIPARQSTSPPLRRPP